MDKMNETDVAWAAGLLEGEGSFVARNVHSCLVTCQMTDLDVLERLQSLFGGSIYSTKKIKDHYKDCWVWHSGSGDSAVRCMLIVLPHMGSRRSAKIQELVNRWTAQGSRLEAGRKARSERNVAILDDYASGEYTYRSLARKYGIDRQTAWNAVNMVS